MPGSKYEYSSYCFTGTTVTAVHFLRALLTKNLMEVEEVRLVYQHARRGENRLIFYSASIRA